MYHLTTYPQITYIEFYLNFGDSKLKDAILMDGLWDPYNNVAMGSCAEIFSR